MTMLATINRESFDESASIESGHETRAWPLFGSRKPMAENDGPERLGQEVADTSAIEARR